MINNDYNNNEKLSVRDHDNGWLIVNDFYV